MDRHGRNFPIELTINPVATIAGLMLSVFMRDITERKEQEARILRLARVYAMLSAVNAVIIRVRKRQQLFEDTTRIVRDAGQFGAAWVGIMGPDAKVVQPVASSGIALSRLAAHYRPEGSAYSEGCQAALKTLQKLEPLIINDLSTAPSGHICADYQSMVALPLRIDATHLGVLVLYADERDFFDEQEIGILRELVGNISFALDHIEKEETLNYLALYDGLTGLPNRTLFADRLAQQILASKRDGSKLALLVLNLERFRNVNETLGLSGGDALLKLVAQRLREIGLGEDNLSRTNGDCFALSLYDVKAESDVARVLQEQILPCFQQSFSLVQGELLVSASVGIALYPDDGDTTDSLFSNAEIMQKKARQSGERFLFYAPGMNTRVARELHLETRLRKAVTANEFVLYYQPKVNLRSGHVTGMEALIRWNDPINGLIPPAEFIPALEETGMIIEVGRWALEQATIDYGRWLTAGLQPPRIAVNVSPIQLRHSDFVASIGRIVESCPHAVDCLDLELTESLLMEDIQSSIRKLKKIKEYKIQIGIDDFGTGYSSLAYLAKLPVDALKIDRTFITNMSDNPDNLMIVTTIISLGHNLGLKVIAEGVETEEQAKFLRLLRCDEMQGFLISKPVPSLEIQAMLKKMGSWRVI